jgi:two-component system, chemotaxis family, CheB/CheR fusion protein
MANGNDQNTDGHAQPERVSTKPVIVGVGASAGGVWALQALFEAIPDNTGASFVVVVHLDPQFHSELPSILAARTRMPVVQVQGTEKLEANHVYVIPPDRRLHISDREISAAEFDQPRGQRAPIDLFFRSLAEEHGDGFAVILTGAGSDGAIGVKAVKESGGIILVQDPGEAEYPSMPRAAIATGIADFVLPVRELARRLVELVRNKDIVAFVETENFDEDVVRRILAHLRVRTGHDFTKYKRSTVLRRIARRMQVTRTDELERYYEFLRDNMDEAQALLGDLLVSVTTFFRDREVWDALKTEVIRQLFATKASNEPLRVWVPGCATGEEAYTVAILLLEEAARHDVHPPIQLFASDLDARALTLAREGRFPSAIATDVSEDRVRRFFMREGDQYHVRREVRDHIVFSNHSVLKDPPFSHLDLISCRNLLIYLDRELQSQVCNTFHYALNAGGFLLVGPAETAENPPGLFRLHDRKARIYQSTAQPGEKPHLLPRLLGDLGRLERGIQVPPGLVSPTVARNEAALHRQALEMVAPPNILVDRQHRVVHLSEHAGRYLQPSGGPLSGDVVELARPELRLELRTALHRVFEHRQSTLTLPILVRFNGAPHRVHIQVKPVIEDDDADTPIRRAVAMFIEGEAVDEAAAVASQPLPADEAVRKLNEELQLTRARLRTTLEESESANEELRAANEELQSINEEYRSTSEELETSKEELQSINEELQTVNVELRGKLDAVQRAHSDLQNLMAATDYGTLFLDSQLHIKRFTDQVTELFRITPSDEGRPIADFALQLDYPDLVKDAETVLAKLTPLGRQARTQNDRWYDIRLRPYRTVDDRIDGVVITFVDVTEHRLVAEALRERERQLQQQKNLVELSRDPIFIWDFDGGILEWNRGCEELYGYSREEAIGRQKHNLLSSTGAGFTFADVRAKLLEEGSWSGELTQRTKDGRLLTVESRIQLESVDGHRLVLESIRDITGRKAMEERQRLLLRELSHRVKNTLAVVQAISHQTLRHSGSKEEFVACFDGRLSALASAHNLLVESDWHGADLAALARQQLEPYAPEEGNRWTIEGEPVLLPADLATPFGLILHELATNAVKHGSLSHPDGKVNLSWSLNSGNNPRVLTVVWREKDGLPAELPAAAGFGTALIDNAIRGAKVNREYRPDGLLCTIEVPLREATENGGPAQA